MYCKNVFSIYLHAQECEVIMYKEIVRSEKADFVPQDGRQQSSNMSVTPLLR